MAEPRSITAMRGKLIPLRDWRVVRIWGEAWPDVTAVKAAASPITKQSAKYSQAAHSPHLAPPVTRKI